MSSGATGVLQERKEAGTDESSPRVMRVAGVMLSEQIDPEIPVEVAPYRVVMIRSVLHVVVLD